MVKRQAGGSWDTAKPTGEDEGRGWPRGPACTACERMEQQEVQATNSSAGGGLQEAPGDRGGEALGGRGRSAGRRKKSQRPETRRRKGSHSLQALQSGPARFGYGIRHRHRACCDVSLPLRL